MLSNENYILAKSRLLEEIEDVTILNMTPAVINKSIILLENNRLRTLAALHLSCALEWEPDLFVSSDKRQIDAAKKAGLSVKII